MKISETISRVRNVIKAIKEDAFLTDRFIYSLIVKYGLAVIRKELLSGGSFYDSKFIRLSCTELYEVDKIDDACCVNVPIYSGCKIMKSRYPLPKILSTDNGYMIRTVASLDYSKRYYFTHPETYNQIMTLGRQRRWNKEGYFYIDKDGYLYLYNDDNKAVTIEAKFYDFSHYISCDNKYSCMNATDFDVPFEDYMFAEIESNVLKDLLTLLNIPSDTNVDDNKSLTR